MLSQKELPDTQQISVFISLSNNDNTDNIEALLYAKKAEGHIQSTTRVYYKAKVFENLSYHYNAENIMDSALLYSQMVLPMIDSIEDTKFVRMFYNSLSIVKTK